MSKVTKAPLLDADRIARDILARLRVTTLRLRCDKVALRFVGRLKTVLASAVPDGQTVLFTISAP
jgi:hypothetical protein